MTIKVIRKLLFSKKFIKTHKTKKEDFTRVRKLTFQILIVIILRNSIKSIQLVLNEITKYIPAMSISNAAYCKGRAKILHTAFIELNKVAISAVTYSDESLYKTFKGFRLLAVDGSKVRLPNTKNVKEEFGIINYVNTKTKTKGENAFAMASVLYDVENMIAIDSVITSIRKGEISLAMEHLKYVKKNDLVLFDRGYASYMLMAKILEKQGDFVIRLASNSFTASQKLLRSKKSKESISIITPHPQLTKKIQAEGNSVPSSLKVRFIKVTLSTGETELLVTSLLDKQKYPRKLFKEIYWKRWGIETFYGKLKTRLELENFTGLSAESVKQDFYSAVFLCGLESILTEDIDTKLKSKKTKHKQQVNKAVSFNLIKDRAFDILLEQDSVDKIIYELEALFITNPTLYRPNKKTPRKKTTSRRLINFLKRTKKYVF